jgi:hypothetical protein
MPDGASNSQPPNHVAKTLWLKMPYSEFALEDAALYMLFMHQ